MTRREALKLLQIPNIYPDLAEVKSSYKKLQAVYDPSNQPPESYDIYVHLLQQLTRAYTKIAAEEGYETFTDESFQKRGRWNADDIKDYRSIFINQGFIGVIKAYFSRLFNTVRSFIVHDSSDDDDTGGDTETEHKEQHKNRKKSHSREQRKNKRKERTDERKNKRKERTDERKNKRKERTDNRKKRRSQKKDQ